MIFSPVFYVALGGALGCSLRYMLTNTVQRLLSISQFPMGTAIVNLIGCLLIGVAVGFFQTRYDLLAWRAFIITGLLGGFTTFSAFSLENVELLKHQLYSMLIINLFGQLILGLLLTLLGLWLVNRLC